MLDQNGEETWELLTAAFDASYDTFFTDEGFGFMHNTAHLKGIPSGNYLSRTGGVINGIFGDYPWGSANHTRLFAEYALKLQNYFESKGLLDKTTIYCAKFPPSSFRFHANNPPISNKGLMSHFLPTILGSAKLISQSTTLLQSSKGC